jgi:hypothetical protein
MTQEEEIAQLKKQLSELLEGFSEVVEQLSKAQEQESQLLAQVSAMQTENQGLQEQLPPVLLPERLRHDCRILLISGQRDVPYHFALVISRVPDVETRPLLHCFTPELTLKRFFLALTSAQTAQPDAAHLFLDLGDLTREIEH